MNPRYLEELSWRMAEVYEATVDQILINLARHFKYYKETGVLPSGGWDYQIKKLAEMGQVNRETEQIILSMLGDADGTLRELLEVSILNGLKDAEPELRLAAKKGLFGSADNIPPVLDPSQMQAFQAYYKQSADKLNLVNTVMLESTQNAYLSTVTDIATRIMNTQGILNVQTGQVVTGVTSINKAIRDGARKMVDNGLTGFIDHGNHHWSPEAYVAMDVRTTMANTARAAVWERNGDYGNDLYQVSYHAGARPLCYDWQGKVISSSDTPRDVEDDEGNTVHVYAQSETTYGEPAGLFGINCGHYPIPFIPGFSRIRPPTQSKEENEKTYRESQQQRALERKLREEKRDLEVMKAQGASEAEIKEQKKRVREASDNINDFCQQTGRTRKRNRETAPIRAEFPEPGGTTMRYNGGYIPANAVPPPKGAFVPSEPQDFTAKPSKPSFTPAQTIEEAETYFAGMCDKNRFGAIGVSYDGVSLDVANTVNRTIGELYNTYNVEPFGGIQAPKGNTKLGKSLGDSATAGYMPMRGSFLLNRKSMSSIEKANTMFKAETDAIRNLLEHPERYDFTKLRSSTREVIERSRISGRATVPNNIQEALTHEFGHALERSVKRHPEWATAVSNMERYANRISGYAGYDEGEYIAESFASFMKGENLCDPTLIRIFKSLRR